MPSTTPPVRALLYALAALSAAACTEPAPSGPETIAPRVETPPAAFAETAGKEPPEYVVLADASLFEGHAVGEGGETPLSAVAFARLVLREDAGTLFDRLLANEQWVPRLYGVAGLWFTDRARHLRLARDLANSSTKVPHQYGCIIGKTPVGKLLEPVRPGGYSSHGSSPAELFAAGLRWLREADPAGEDLGYWRSVLLKEEASGELRLRAARVLAYSFGRDGLDSLLRLMPLLAADLRGDIGQVLESIPPWVDGTLEVAGKALESQDRSVQMAALSSLQSLLTWPRSRAACHALVPRLEALLRSYRHPDGGLPTEDDEAWIGKLLSVLKWIGGPAGPVLARAWGHPEPIVRDNLEYPDPSDLGPWTGQSIAELARQLENPDASVRALVIRNFCGLLDPGPPPPPEEVIVEVEKQLPAIRRAIQTLEAEEREGLEEWLDELLRHRAPAAQGR
jgi:hypothetical protein